MNYREEMYKLLESNGCTETGLNPGGRYFVFKDGTRITVHNFEDKEDYERILKYVEEGE